MALLYSRYNDTDLNTEFFGEKSSLAFSFDLCICFTEDSTSTLCTLLVLIFADINFRGFRCFRRSSRKFVPAKKCYFGKFCHFR